MVSNIFRTKLALVGAIAMALVGCSSSPKQESSAAKPTSVITTAGTTTPAQTASAPARPAVAAPMVSPAPAPAPAPAPMVAPAPVQAPAATQAAAPQSVASSLKAETGLYRCEEKQTVAVKRVIDGGKKIVIGFAGKDHELASVQTETGALRFENKQAGYTWIQLANAALLLDTKKGQRVANQCKL